MGQVPQSHRTLAKDAALGAESDQARSRQLPEAKTQRKSKRFASLFLEMLSHSTYGTTVYANSNAPIADAPADGRVS